MTIYTIKRVFPKSVGCSLSKYVLFLLAYCPQFSINSLVKDSELSPHEVEEALDYLVAKKLIKFRNGTCQGRDGTEYQVEILF